jgi:hypothetical protein
MLRRNYVPDSEVVAARELGEKLFAKIQSMRKSLGRSFVGDVSGHRSAVGGRQS